MAMSTGAFDGRSGLTFVRHVVSVDQDDRRLRRERDAGIRRRVRRGAYVDEDLWVEFTPLQRYQVKVQAVAGTRRLRPVIAFDSAAALWGYPRLGAWPSVVHIIVDPASGARSRNGVAVHRDRLEPEDVVEIDGMLVTSPARTLVDLARNSERAVSVAAIDRALNKRRTTPQNRVDVQQLIDVCDRVVTSRGGKRARLAIEFSDGRADNAAESVSRVQIFELGFPAPVLQRRHVNPRGGNYYTDFEWPDFMVIGELDGLGKYLKEEYLGSMNPGDAVVKEKIREDALRAEGNRVARWLPEDLLHPGRLRRILLNVGLPIVR